MPASRWLRDPLQGWQASRGISGSFRLDSVAALPWNQWQLSCGTGGRFAVESVAGLAWNTHRGVRNVRDKTGQTIDFLLTRHRDERAAKRFMTKAIRRHGVPEKITIDGSAANEAAIKSYNEEHGTAIVIRQVKYLNNVVEQDHRGVKRITRPMLGFKAFDAAQSTLVGIELMHMLRKGQLAGGVEQGLTVAEQFYALAA